MQQEFQETAENLTSQQCEIVFQALDAMMESPHFSKSKRYPALLQYVVSKTISGEQGELKERVIGVQLFGRPADYDTGSDPVVRVVLNELRKRLSIYNSEHPDLPVVIELPIGGYGAHFTFQSAALLERASGEGAELTSKSEETDSESALKPNNEEAKEQTKGRYFRKPWLMTAVAALLVMLVGGMFYHALTSPKFGIWGFLQNSKSPALIIIDRTLDAKESQVFALAAEIPGGERNFRHKVSLGDAIAVADVCSVLGAMNKSFRIRPSDRAFMADLYNNPVVLIGDTNSNPWIERLQAPLRYQIVRSPNGENEIIDRKSAANAAALHAQIDPRTQAVLVDYAIVAVFYSSATDNQVALIGGLNGLGVRSAADLATSIEGFHNLLAMAPKGWKGSQFEVVLRTEVLQDHPGHVQVVGTDFGR